ncbi:MAG: alpha-amylase, partial [Lysobacter sp.]|nr:alpha-amylase [Lysobacter sp.]
MHSGPRIAALGLLLWAGSTLAATPGEGPLHVPSPDWRDQVLYFLMIDRFANGDRGNDDQHTGEFDPADNAKWSGGDLKGARDRIPYVQALGATGVWITPPVANQWWNPRAHYGGYHGYWATD